MQDFKHNRDDRTTSSAEVTQAISAWLDGDAQISMPEVLETEQGKQTWQLYHLIGDALRTPELALLPATEFSARLAQAIAAEPALSVTPVPVNNSIGSRMRDYGWPVFAMAAAVASVVWVLHPFFSPEMNDSSSHIASAEPAVVVASKVELDDMHAYVTAHRQFSGPASVRQVSYGATK